MSVQFVGSHEIAAMLKISPDSARRRAETGEIPAVRVGRFWRYDPDEVVAHLKAARERRDPWARSPGSRRALNRRRSAA